MKRILILAALLCSVLHAQVSVRLQNGSTVLRDNVSGRLTLKCDGTSLTCTVANNSVFTLGIGTGTLADPGLNGIVVRTAAGTTTARSLGVASPLTVSNADGTAGSPTLGMVNQGQTTTVLHGNAAGNPSFGSVVIGDVSASTGTGSFMFGTAPTVTTLTSLGVQANTGNLTVAAIATPTAVTSVVPQTAGGAKTATYKIVCTLSDGTHTAASNATSTADAADNLTAANHGNVLTFPACPIGSTGNLILYRTSFTGTTPAGAAATGLIATLAVTATGYTDAGANGGAEVAPTSNNTGSITSVGAISAANTITSTGVGSGFVVTRRDTSAPTWTIYGPSGTTDFRLFDQSIDAFSMSKGGVVNIYNGVATLERGLPASHWNATATAQSANIAATDFSPAISSATAGRYRLTCYIAVTQQATNSSILPACNLICTDPVDSVVKTIQVTPAIQGVAANPTTGVGVSGSGMCDAKAATAIQFSTTGYTSVGVTSMAYKLYAILEAQ